MYSAIGKKVNEKNECNAAYETRFYGCKLRLECQGITQHAGLGRAMPMPARLPTLSSDALSRDGKARRGISQTAVPAVFLDGDGAAGAKVFQAFITASSVILRLLPTRLPPARVEQVQRRDNGLHEHPDALGKRVRHEGS